MRQSTEGLRLEIKLFALRFSLEGLTVEVLTNESQQMF